MAEKKFKGIIQIEGKLGSSVKDSFGALSSITQKLTKDFERFSAAGRNINALMEKGLGAGIATERFEKLNRTIKNTKTALDGVRLAQSGLNQIGAGLSRFGIGNGYLAAAATFGVGDAIKHMLHAQAVQEQSLIALQVMDRSRDRAKQDLAWIDNFAYTTPFQIPEVRDAFVRLKGRGLDPTKDELLKTLGDAAAGNSRTLADAVQAFDDALVNRNQMIAGFGIKVIEEGVGQGKALVEFTNHAGKQISVLIDKTNMEVKKRLYLDIWKDRFGGLMEEQSHSWLGMMSNLLDYAQRFGIAIMQSGPFDKLKANLQGILDAIAKSVKDGTFQKTAEEWGKTLAQLIDLMTEVGKAAFWLLRHLGGLTFIFYSLSALIGSSVLLKLWGLAKGLKEITMGAIQVFSALRKLASLVTLISILNPPVLITVGIVTALAAAAALIWWKWKPIKEFFVSIGHAIYDGLGAALVWVKTKLDELLAAFEKLPSFFSNFGDMFRGGGWGGAPFSLSAAPAGSYGFNLGAGSSSLLPTPVSGSVSSPLSSGFSSYTLPPTTSNKTDNRQYNVVIHTQPGQDPHAIASLVVQRMQSDQTATQKGALYDP